MNILDIKYYVFLFVNPIDIKTMAQFDEYAKILHNDNVKKLEKVIINIFASDKVKKLSISPNKLYSLIKNHMPYIDAFINDLNTDNEIINVFVHNYHNKNCKINNLNQVKSFLTYVVMTLYH